MNNLQFLSELEGHGTSMITLTIVNSPKALDNAISLLNREYHTATNVKSRV